MTTLTVVVYIDSDARYSLEQPVVEALDSIPGCIEWEVKDWA